MRTKFFLLEVFSWWPVVSSRTISSLLGPHKVSGLKKKEIFLIPYFKLREVEEKNISFHYEGRKYRWVFKAGNYQESANPRKIKLNKKAFLELRITHL